MARAKTSKAIAREIERSFKQRKQQIEESMKNLDPGCRAYLDRVIALAKLEQSYREERAKRGVDPLNLGVATSPEFVFIARTSTAPDTRDAARKELEARYDAEFGYDDNDDEEPPQSAPAAVVPRRKR
jgi:hypothetical protein